MNSMSEDQIARRLAEIQGRSYLGQSESSGSGGTRLAEIEGLIYSQVFSLKEWQMQSRPTRDEAVPLPRESEWHEVNLPAQWGGGEMTTWFRCQVVVPKEFAGKVVVLSIQPGGLDTEGLVSINGLPCQGLNTGRNEVLLTHNAESGQTFDILIEASAGVKKGPWTFSRCDLAVLDPEVEAFYYDAKVAFEAALVIPEGSSERERLLQVVYQSLMKVEIGSEDRESFLDSLTKAGKLLKRDVYATSQKSRTPRALLLGHTHIDTAWGWRKKETVRKIARTFTNTLRCLEQYPEFIFLCPPARLYQVAKEYYPQLYQQVKQRIAEGRWEVWGGMWIEPDCNLSGGESLIRQILFNRRFLLEEFGLETEILFLPDTYGNTWSLPQIARKSGIRYFVYGRSNVPHSLFWWQGIDGTRLLSILHLGYGGEVSPKGLKERWERVGQKGILDEYLYFYGYADGGGGITRPHLEYARRLKGFDGLPSVVHGRLEEYLQRVDAVSDKLPVWNGELYNDNLRATYTTVALEKKNLRRAEALLHDAEAFSSLASLVGFPYQQDELNQAWEKLLVNQDHGIVSGVSIEEVHADSAGDYQELFAIGSEVLEDATRWLVAKIDTTGKGEAMVVFNTLSWSRNGLVRIKLDADCENLHIQNQQGEMLPCQLVDLGNNQRELAFLAQDVPPLGYATFRLVKGEAPAVSDSLEVSETSLDNRFFHIELDSQGNIISLVDKRVQREIISQGKKANELQTFEDLHPAGWAWDMDLSYQDHPLDIFQIEEIKVVDKGPLYAAVRVIRRSKNSVIMQRIVIYSHIPRIDFETQIDWHEKEVLLKAAFPVEVHSSQATYEIQFGNIQRPTHWNTSWDKAKFEVWGHKWADLSEGNCGVSLLNDSKYGYDIKDNVMRLTLLRTTKNAPFEFEVDKALWYTDQGRHRFVYSLYPHAGGWREGKTLQQAYELNLPLHGVIESAHKGDLPPQYSFVRTDAENVIVETLKKAEEGDELILRVWEAYGQRGEVSLSFSNKLKKVVECDLMEREIEAIKPKEQGVSFFIKPYEIKTFRVEFQSTPLDP